MESVNIANGSVFIVATIGWVSFIFMMLKMKQLDKRITKLEEGNDTLSKE